MRVLDRCKCAIYIWPCGASRNAASPEFILSTLLRNAGIGLWLVFTTLANSDELVIPGPQQTLPSSPLLRQTPRSYGNYAIDLYANYPNHSFPYAETRKAFYGPTGNYLATRYNLFSWSETRRPEQL